MGPQRVTISKTGETMRRSITDYWSVAISLYPLWRCALLAGPVPGVSAMQLAERFFWLTFWPVEALAILAAVANGFRIASAIRSLPRAVRLLLLAWLTSLILGTVTAGYPGAAFRSAIGWVVHATFALALWHLASRNPAQMARRFEQFANLLPWMTLAAGMLTMTQVFRIGLSSDYPFVTDLPGFAHIRHTGYIFAPAIAVCLGYLAVGSRAAGGTMILLGLNTALCLWFGSRGPFLGLMIGLAITALMLSEFRHPVFLARCAASLATGACLSVLVPSPDNQGFNALKRFFGSSTDMQEFSSGRTAFWKETVHLILDRPWFGHGGEQFRFISKLADHTYRHPHDFVLQFLFDWGLVGGGAALILLACMVAAALKGHRQGTPASKIGLLGVISMLGFALIDGILFYPFTIAVTIVFLTMAMTPTVAGRPHSCET